MVVWFRKRKKPRFYRTPQEAWLDFVELAHGGFAKVGLPLRVQIYATEVDADSFFQAFFPEDVRQGILGDYHSGKPEAMLAALRGLLLYAMYRQRFQAFLVLTVGAMLAEGRDPLTSSSSVKDAGTGEVVATGTFYGRYPVFVVHARYSHGLEDRYRALGLRRLDRGKRPAVQGYVRWLPTEFQVEEEEEAGEAPEAWEALPALPSSPFLAPTGS